MFSDLKTQLQAAIAQALQKYTKSIPEFPPVILENPADKLHGEISCNVAMKAAKLLKKSPLQIAGEFVPLIEAAVQASPIKDKIAKVEIKNPGFINFYLSKAAIYDILQQVFHEQDNFGRSKFGQGTKVQIEFVSANPTGPLSVAHARQAAVGDALANILNFVGFDCKKEFYVNDEGNQINILGRSIMQRAQEILGETVTFAEDNYQGEYIKDMAQEFMDKRHIKTADQLKKVTPPEFSQYGVDDLLTVIKKELDDFGVRFDVWAHQSKIADPAAIQSVLDYLGEKGFLYEKEGALWFKSTDFGDDKDRVLEKSDGSFTYFTPDIAYHRDKYARGFKKVFNIWGPDHHGYIPRLTAAVEALGYDREVLQVLIVQLATIFRNGQPVSMSTRRGQYISLREVMEEVGVDAARFFFLMRHINAHLDFDLELAKKETPENPVYYIQYAHARIHSIVAKAKETDAALKPQTSGFKLLGEPAEMDLIKKIGTFPDILLICEQQMDPFALVDYLQDLATCFHKFYDQHRVVDPENKELSNERLALSDATRIALANGLTLLGVTAPKKMTRES